MNPQDPKDRVRKELIDAVGGLRHVGALVETPVGTTELYLAIRKPKGFIDAIRVLLGRYTPVFEIRTLPRS